MWLLEKLFIFGHLIEHCQFVMSFPWLQKWCSTNTHLRRSCFVELPSLWTLSSFSLVSLRSQNAFSYHSTCHSSRCHLVLFSFRLEHYSQCNLGLWVSYAQNWISSVPIHSSIQFIEETNVWRWGYICASLVLTVGGSNLDSYVSSFVTVRSCFCRINVQCRRVSDVSPWVMFLCEMDNNR